MQRTLKRELNSTWNCWKGTDGRQCDDMVWCVFRMRRIFLIIWRSSFLGRMREVLYLSSEDMGIPSFIWETLTKCLLSPRLETRTKESNMCASVWGWISQRVINVKANNWVCWGRKLWLHYRPTMILRENGLSVSIHVGTRKMVNYAWVGRSQGKLWWRSAAILTCKLIVELGYRGERLIEPSSSWFLPKFPSG